MQNLISEQLTGYGFNEILNNSLTSGAYYETLTTFPKENNVLLKNPLSAELDVMRPTLHFYEFGNVYAFYPEKQQENNPLAAIKKEFHLSFWLTGNNVSNSWIRPAEKTSVYELKALVENIFVWRTDLFRQHYSMLFVVEN